MRTATTSLPPEPSSGAERVAGADRQRPGPRRPARRGHPGRRWEEWGLPALEAEAVDDDGAGRVERRYPGGIVHRQVLSAVAGGGVLVEEEVVVPDGLDDLPRVDSVLTVAPGLERLEWFGRGPVETCPDRKLGAPVQRSTSTVADEYVPYVHPQEHGGHEDVREVRLVDPGTGAGLGLGFAEPLHVSASHFTAGDLAAATHDVELVPRAETTVHVDAAHRGLGTASCGPDTLPATSSAPAPTAGAGRSPRSRGASDTRPGAPGASPTRFPSGMRSAWLHASGRRSAGGQGRQRAERHRPDQGGKVHQVPL